MSGLPSFLHCRWAGGSVALPLAEASGLAGSEQLQRTPKPGPLAGWLLGLEHELPVYDLAALLGLPSTRPGNGAKVVLCGRDGSARGLLVEEASEVRVSAPDLLARPRILDRPDLGPWVGAIALQGELVPWLDPSRLHADLAPFAPPPGAPAPAARAPLPPPPAAAARALVTFAAGDGAGGEGVSCALSLSQVVEVVDPGAVVGLPGAPRFLLGLIPWRGRALPILDLSPPLDGGRSAARAPRRALIARTRDPTDCIALAAGGEVKMRRLPLASRLVEPPGGVAQWARNALLGCAEIDGAKFVIPDLERLLWAASEDFDRAA